MDFQFLQIALKSFVQSFWSNKSDTKVGGPDVYTLYPFSPFITMNIALKLYCNMHNLFRQFDPKKVVRKSWGADIYGLSPSMN